MWCNLQRFVPFDEVVQYFIALLLVVLLFIPSCKYRRVSSVSDKLKTVALNAIKRRLWFKLKHNFSVAPVKSVCLLSVSISV
jgi:hypothetical protein